MIERKSYAHTFPLAACRRSSSSKTPEPHQADALEKLHTWYRPAQQPETSHKGAILALPTGGGKTFTAVQFLAAGALSDGAKVLWLAHTHHLLEQAFGTFDAGVLRHVREPRDSLSLRIVSGTPGHYAPSSIKDTDDVVIATLQTVTHAHKQKLPQLQAFLTSAKGKLFVVFDEAHHAPAPSYRKLLGALREEHGATLLGLTATPTYSDESKRGWLGKLFPQGIVAKASPSELMSAGVLARPHFEPHLTSFVPNFDAREYEKWRGTARDLPDDIVRQLAESRDRNQRIVATYVASRERYGKTIVFASSWIQCEQIVTMLKDRGVSAGAVYSHVDATLPYEARQKRDRNENARVLERFRQKLAPVRPTASSQKDGPLEVLVNVRMLTEGTDLPDAQTVFITRQTTSKILMTQMIGRALRGPKFGGTTDAYIVLFQDDWQQAIRFADYTTLDGRADDTERPPGEHTPLDLISIELVRRLARQMDTGDGAAIRPFLSLVPEGWFHVQFDILRPESEDVEAVDRLVLVYDDERRGLDAALVAVPASLREALSDEAVELDSVRVGLESLREAHLASVNRDASDILETLFLLGRHLGQGGTPPRFFPFASRTSHDLDAFAHELHTRDLRMSELRVALENEYHRKDRFWRTLFPRHEQFRRAYELRAAGIEQEPTNTSVTPTADTPPPPREPTPEDKKQVQVRDGHRCLACGTRKFLQVDHVEAAFYGGSHHIDNLQTLCKTCNQKKGTETIRFTEQTTRLRTAPAALAEFQEPDDPGDREHWIRFLRRTVNFTFRCAAVSEIVVGGRGDSYYNWSVELVGGNRPAWLAPYLEDLFARIQDARVSAGKPAITSISVHAPGADRVCFPLQSGGLSS